MIGCVVFAEAVWNTSRVPRLADAAYQARLQALTSMVFTLGLTGGALWAGLVVDRLGVQALNIGAAALAAASDDRSTIGAICGYASNCGSS